MQFGKYEISEYVICAICFVVLILGLMHFAVKEQEVNIKSEEIKLEIELEKLKIERLEKEGK